MDITCRRVKKGGRWTMRMVVVVLENEEKSIFAIEVTEDEEKFSISEDEGTQVPDSIQELVRQLAVEVTKHDRTNQ